MTATKSITVYGDDPIFPAVLAMLGGVENPTKSGKGEKSSTKGTSQKSGSDESEDEGEDKYADMSRGQLRQEAKKRDIKLKRGISEEDIIKLLLEDEGLYDSNDEDDEEDDDDEVETNDEDDEDDEEDEVEIEVGMKVKCKIRGKKKTCVVKKVLHEEGKVKLRTPEGKIVTVTPEQLDLD